MPIDLGTIKSKAAAQLTTANILSATTVVLALIIGWDVLVSRYGEFVEWAPGVATAVGRVYSILISLVVVVVLHTTISGLLELVYFGPLKRLNKLEKKANEEIPQLQGRSFCQSMLLSILAGDMTDSQRQQLENLTKFVEETSDRSEREGALAVLKELHASGTLDSPARLTDSD